MCDRHDSNRHSAPRVQASSYGCRRLWRNMRASGHKAIYRSRFQFADHSFAMLLTGPKSIDQSRVRHGSVQTTERYLGCTQRIVSAVNDRIGIEPKREASGPEQWPTSRSNIDRRKGFVGTDLLNFRKTNCGRKHPRLTLRPGNQLQMRLPPQPAQSAEPMIQNPVCRGYSAAAAPFQTSVRGSSDISCS